MIPADATRPPDSDGLPIAELRDPFDAATADAQRTTDLGAAIAAVTFADAAWLASELGQTLGEGRAGGADDDLPDIDVKCTQVTVLSLQTGVAAPTAAARTTHGAAGITMIRARRRIRCCRYDGGPAAIARRNHARLGTTARRAEAPSTSREIHGKA